MKSKITLNELKSLYREEIASKNSGYDGGALSESQYAYAVKEITSKFVAAAYMLGTSSPDVDDFGIHDIQHIMMEATDTIDELRINSAMSNGKKTGRARILRKLENPITAAYWSGVTRSLPLPVVPGEQCNCSPCDCEWKLESLDIEEGNWNAYWVCGTMCDKDCQICGRRQAAWNPYKIRNNEGEKFNPSLVEMNDELEVKGQISKSIKEAIDGMEAPVNGNYPSGSAFDELPEDDTIGVPAWKLRLIDYIQSGFDRFDGCGLKKYQQGQKLPPIRSGSRRVFYATDANKLKKISLKGIKTGASLGLGETLDFILVTLQSAGDFGHITVFADIPSRQVEEAEEGEGNWGRVWRPIKPTEIRGVIVNNPWGQKGVHELMAHHRKEVGSALRRGDPVPPEVAAEYSLSVQRRRKPALDQQGFQPPMQEPDQPIEVVEQQTLDYPDSGSMQDYPDADAMEAEAQANNAV